MHNCITFTKRIHTTVKYIVCIRNTLQLQQVRQMNYAYTLRCSHVQMPVAFLKTPSYHWYKHCPSWPFAGPSTFSLAQIGIISHSFREKSTERQGEIMVFCPLTLDLSTSIGCAMLLGFHVLELLLLLVFPIFVVALCLSRSSVLLRKKISAQGYLHRAEDGIESSTGHTQRIDPPPTQAPLSTGDPESNGLPLKMDGLEYVLPPPMREAYLQGCKLLVSMRVVDFSQHIPRKKIQQKFIPRCVTFKLSLDGMQKYTNNKTGSSLCPQKKAVNFSFANVEKSNRLVLLNFSVEIVIIISYHIM